MTSSGGQMLEFPIEIAGAPGASFAGFFYPAQRHSRSVLQVLVHGNSYDHRYWDAERVNGRNYSYVAYMVARGFDVLAIDLPGVGASSKPDGRAVTIGAVGKALSDLILAAREGRMMPNRRFDHVSLVGHSLGSMVGVYAEANWPAADSLIVLGAGFFAGRATSGWAPGVRERLLESEYPLLPPEERQKFYYAEQADPDVVDYDNRVLRTTMPARLWADTIAFRESALGVADIECPVYVQLGDNDPIMLGEYAAQERASYASSREVIIDRLPEAGHCMNLHLNRSESWTRIVQYFDR